VGQGVVVLEGEGEMVDEIIIKGIGSEEELSEGLIGS